MQTHPELKLRLISFKMIDRDAEASEQDDWDVEDESNYPQTSDSK
jgi:hypothetical protein